MSPSECLSRAQLVEFEVAEGDPCDQAFRQLREDVELEDDGHCGMTGVDGNGRATHGGTCGLVIDAHVM